ncbi:hypothetical protein FHR83_008825 [Actinoplanes campanulatus]|uniref:DUF1918 domain-containing protein n=1 Tax=Actinoplanes campanulatus TaxID=113559 RepID=A0A7W5FJY3_9ACTN|nr:DUF1918 domain-containing protein [Actinoplanes campanulatus]MBB3101097.1 hypothetical protein [Actinoplanes campanulatus]GGN51819.1 hypothetical protein GCM10010109_92280 [Actinoplanes campanulatus]GID42042.1 hypothetical protein Aca09nite_85480 [Actinoplanes campanulatus]
MKAHVGDRVVVEAVRFGGERRIGIITTVEHTDGTPPYRVHWLNDGRTTLLFPGPETHIEPAR